MIGGQSAFGDHKADAAILEGRCAAIRRSEDYGAIDRADDRGSSNLKLERDLLFQSPAAGSLREDDAYVVAHLNPSFSTHGVGDPGKGSRTTSWSKGLPHRSDVLVLSQKLSPGADARRRLGRQGELELFEQQFVISLRASVAA